MIIGSGLLAQAFSHAYSARQDVCLYAAGVSNSNCTNANEFDREHQRLSAALKQAAAVDTFVYFGTCSIADPETCNSPYVLHKLAMEQLLQIHPRFLVFRLPQVAGRTPNPHTLLNYLYARISRSEAFNLWCGARRNIIDVDDVVAIASQLIDDPGVGNQALNIANVTNYSMLEIVHALELATGKVAVYDCVERGSEYHIDVSAILPVLEQAGVNFGDGYLNRVINKHYGKVE